MYLRRIAILCVSLLLCASSMPESTSQVNAQDEVPQQELDEMKAALDAAHRELQLTWDPWFRDLGLRAPEAAFIYLQPGEPDYVSNCVNAGNVPGVVTPYDQNTYYCEREIDFEDGGTSSLGALIFPIEPLARILRGDVFGEIVPESQKTDEEEKSELGLFVLALVAHEWGHNVQDELMRQTGRIFPSGLDGELLSDCFAGDFIGQIEPEFTGSGRLSDQDVIQLPDEIVELEQEESTRLLLLALSTVGDPREGGSHGTAGQRLAAFEIGYEAANGEDAKWACLRTFWEAFPVPQQ